MKYENVNKFLSEIYVLKRQEHVGFKLAGVKSPDSLAEHTLISAQIGYIIACLEGANPEKTAAICIFHDNHEARIGDHHKVSSRYLDTELAESNAEAEQLTNLPDHIADRVIKLLNEVKKRDTQEGIIAKDADWLETAIQAKIYMEQGYKGCEDWISNVEKALETDSAKQLLADIRNDNDFTNCWWKGLKKMTYTKLDNK